MESTTHNELPLITPDQKTGKFKHSTASLDRILEVAPLNIARGRQAYGNRYKHASEKDQGSKPICSSADGFYPRIPWDARGEHGYRLPNAGLAHFCQTCSLREEGLCRDLWELTVVLLATDSLARLSLGTLSQSALEQYIVKMNIQIKEAKDLGIDLHICDFALTLELEKRSSMRMYGLAYPTKPNSIFQIPMVNGVSKFHDLYSQYNRDTEYQLIREQIQAELSPVLPVVDTEPDEVITI